eukprot:CAMPEP_0172929710 /NCGR_PEP_ID=MMETSP1075-20121228/218615_1 /TAXON_ID=2916 /ORGANISM="Ceratium fusus, Strain PA161109" /LENGTH=364 /DNA_ID=CAMNT_0013791011 /DNA_START=370 /DNA_END=1465 /DNA_ORIENTATION=+
MQVGAVAREMAHQSSGNFSYVVSSPYVRCVETAVEVCRALQLPMCIDRQLGEVFGPACFGEWSATGPLRRNAEDVAACVPPDLRRLSPIDCIGQEPTWPESIEDARLRMVARVEQYAEWAARLEGVNFVLVTHGDCVGSCLTLALARGVPTAEKVVEKVDYCGYALLERTWDPGEPSIGLMDDTAKWQVMHGHVVLRDRSEPASNATDGNSNHAAPSEAAWKQQQQQQQQQQQLMQHGGHNAGGHRGRLVLQRYSLHRASSGGAQQQQQQQQQQQLMQHGGHNAGRTSRPAAAAAGATTLLSSQSQLRRSLKQRQVKMGLTLPLGDVPPKAWELNGAPPDDLYPEDFLSSGREWADSMHGVSGL